MLRRFLKERPSVYDELIANVMTRMNTCDPSSDDYQRLMDRLSKLNELKAKEASSNRVSPDTKFMVIGGVVQVVIIVVYERGHVMVSRALNFVKTKS